MDSTVTAIVKLLLFPVMFAFISGIYLHYQYYSTRRERIIIEGESFDHGND
jgi:hypothetical protein